MALLVFRLPVVGDTVYPAIVIASFPAIVQLKQQLNDPVCSL